VGAAVDPINDELVELSREGYRMFREHDPAFLERLDPEIEWHVSDTLPGGGELHGTWEVLAFLDATNELWEDAHPDPEEFLPAGDTLIVLGNWRARVKATGVTVTAPFAHVQRFRDGKLAYFHNHVDTAKVLRSLEAPAG
jgi:ketosteroid isomerase-like protein